MEDIFSKWDVDGSGGLSISEAMLAVEDCSIVARDAEETKEIVAMILEFDQHGSGELDKQEFVHLVIFLSARIRKIRAEKERQQLFLYYPDTSWEEYRSAFDSLDDEMRDTLSLDALRTLTAMVRPAWSPVQVRFILTLVEGIEGLSGEASDAAQVSFSDFLSLESLRRSN